MSSSTSTGLSAFEAGALFNVRGLVAVVTGGGSGLGLYAAHALAANGAGRVYILGRRGAMLASAGAAYPAQIVGLEADVTSKASLAAAAARISEPVDVVLANAGVSGPILGSYGESNGAHAPADALLAELADVDEHAYRAILDVNVLGTYWTALTFLPLLRKHTPRPDGYLPQLIVVSSNAAWAKLPILNPIYNVSKTAASHLAQILSTVMADAGVRVNTIEPGLYPSEMTSTEQKDPETGYSRLSHTNGADIPIGRCGLPSEHAAAVLYLASRGNLFANGTTLRVDGAALQKIPASD